jgi:hypothetical protein
MERFVEKIVESSTGCWEWMATRGVDGYGRFYLNTRDYAMAHRWGYEHLVGPIPEGLQLDHLCRVRHCVNPRHLEPVTSQENLLRSPITRATINKSKVFCRQGHALTGSNVLIGSDGYRRCHECQKRSWRDWHRRNYRSLRDPLDEPPDMD